MKDKKAVIFYFLMTIVLMDFGNQLRKIFENPYFAQKIDNPIFSILKLFEKYFFMNNKIILLGVWQSWR